MKNRYSLYVLLAGTLWGFMGFFRRTLDGMGVSAVGVIAIRGLFAALFFGAVMLISRRSDFKIKLKDFWIFFGCGIISLMFFGFCYFKAMDHMSLSTAAILLYTAPSFVMLMSVLLFGEKLTGRKLLALALAFLGCCFVSGIGTGEGHITLVGFAFGIGAGLFYALYSIFARFALNRGYSSFTVNFYACILAAVGATLLDKGTYVPIVFESDSNALFCTATGFFSCFLPYLFYTKGLEGLENSKASTMASVEPVVATLLGVVMYDEKLTLIGIFGIILVLSAIVILNTNLKSSET